MQYAHNSRTNHLGIGDNYSQAASLSHTVILHADAAEMNLINTKTGEAHWFCQEAWAGGIGHGRGLHQSRMWRDDGLHIASSIQDGMVRLGQGDGSGKRGFSPKGMILQLQKSGKRNEKL